ncbi:MAG: leucine-rich repeat domain-containing protein [Clostridium sp.]|nr:leucine-rich repeat domain-containing protein [Clostridium sp.]
MKRRMISALLSVVLVIATICVSNLPSAAVEPNAEMMQEEMQYALETSEAVTEEATETTTEKVTEEGTQVTTEEVAGEKMQVTTEEVTEEGTDATTEEVTEEGTDATTELMTDENTSENTTQAEVATADDIVAVSEASETADTVSDAVIVTASETVTEVAIDETNFPDSNFRSYVKQFDTDGNESFSSEELLAVKDMVVSGEKIENLKGVEYFTALSSLDCQANQLTSLDVSNCTALCDLNCNNNQLTSLDVSRCTALEGLQCMGNQLTRLDVSNCTALRSLYCNNNQLTSLDVSRCIALTRLDCSENQLTSLDVSNCTALGELLCENNRLTSLDVSNCTALIRLCCENNQLASLDVSNCTALAILTCHNNQLTNLNVSNNTSLWELDCCHNQLTSLDVSSCADLRALCCVYNELTSLDVSNNTALQALYDSNNPFNSSDVVIEIAPEMKLDDEAYDVLINSAFTEAEIKSGKHLKVDLIVAALSEASVGQSDFEAIKTAAKKRKIAVILDMNIVKFIDGIVSGNVNKLDKEITITITIDVPKEFQAANRKFSIIRLHDGIAEELPDLDDNPNTVTFTTGKFSLYTLIYEDAGEGTALEPPKNDTPSTVEPTKNNADDANITPADNTKQTASPNTGDTALITVVFILMLVSAVLVVICTRKIKRHNSKL